MFNEIKHLLIKELRLEWRQKYAFNGILLYLLSTLFVVYLSAFEAKSILWIALFWIILLFASVNAVAKSFMGEGRWRQLYYYTIAKPQAVILAKMIHNTLLMMILSMSGLFFYTLILGNPIHSFFFFMLVVFAGSISFSLCFTMMSAIASKANNNSTLMVVLSFPVIVPVLLVLLKLSLAALDESLVLPVKDLVVLGGLNMILLIMALILFPYLWHE